MRFLGFCLLLLAGIEAAPADSLKLVNLTAKVDSLSQVLKESKLAADYAKEAMQAIKDGNTAYKEANANVKDIFKLFISAVLSVFLTGFGAIGYFIYRRSKDERDFVANQVKDMVIPGFNQRIDAAITRTNGVEADLGILQGNYSSFTAVTEREIKDAQDGLTKIKDALGTRLDPMKRIRDIENRVTVIEVGEVSGQLHDKHKKIQESISGGNLSYMITEIIDGIKRIDSIEPKGVLKFHYRPYADLLIQVLKEATGIRPETKGYLLEVKPMLAELDARSVEHFLAKIPDAPSGDNFQSFLNPDPKII